MPTDMHRRLYGQVPPIQWQQPPGYRPTEPMISNPSWSATGSEQNTLSGTNYVSATYGGASLLVAYPFCITDYYLVKKVWWNNGTTVGTDSANVAVYDMESLALVVQGSNTLIAGSGLIQESDCTDTQLHPGRYYCAYYQTGVTATPCCTTYTAPNARMVGYVQQASVASAFPNPLVPAAVTAVNFPLFGISSRVQTA